MNVCVIQTVLDPYKGANHLPLFAALPNIEFTILCNRSQMPESDLPKNVRVVTAPGRTGSYYYGFADYCFASLIFQKFPADGDFWKQFDVIHINQVMGPALKDLLITQVPAFLLIHHPVTADLEIAVEESGFLEGVHWRLKYFLLKRWQKKMCQIFSVVTVSHTMKDRIAGDYGCDPENISIVPNGVDGDLFSQIPDSECTADVSAVGAFVHPRKGFRYLADLYRKLSPLGLRITDVGRRTDEQLAELKKIPGVTVLGTVTEEELIDRMRHSRVLVSTSLYEGFGLSLIEALACGHPAFAFRVGAVPEVLGSIDVNLLIEPRNTDEMAKSVQEFLALSPEERMRRGDAYSSSVRRYYSLITSAFALKNLYVKLSS